MQWVVLEQMECFCSVVEETLQARIMIAGLSFLLGFEKIEDDDTDDSGSEDDDATQQPHVVVNKEALYKVGLKAHPYYHISGIAADSSKF
ncbi:hypothetical protein ACS0TY_021422 [Phlomoides rotata]